MNILLWLAYKGTNYSGFQVQPNGITVCAVVQDAMQSVFGTRPDVKGCSRTDAGVHARRFALNFHYDGRIPVQRIPLALNARLPMDVRALTAQQVPAEEPEAHSAKKSCLPTKWAAAACMAARSSGPLTRWQVS